MRFLGWLFFLFGTLASLTLTFLDQFPHAHTWHVGLIVAATFIPFLWVTVTLALLGLIVLLRGWVKAGAVIALAVALLFWGRGFLPLEGEPDMVPALEGLTVFMLNTQYGRADVGQVKAVIEEHEPDVVVFLEHTAAFDEGVTASGIREAYPHQVGTIREDAGGTMILGRQPLTEVERLDTTNFDNIVVSTTVRDTEWVLAGIHTSPPQLGVDHWARDGEDVRDLALRHVGRQFLMIGDFNAIDQHYTMRLLRDVGLRNGMRGQTGADGWRPTWPVGGRIPAFARIDHVLYGPGVLGWAPRTVQIDGSDHLGLVASTGLRQP